MHISTGLIDLSTPIISFLESLSSSSKTQDDPSSSTSIQPTPNLSDFLLSSHLHTPRLRLVSGSKNLKLRLRFAHVPDVEDGEELTWFLPSSESSSSSGASGRLSSEIIESICNELGLRRVVLQGSKSARVEYALASFNPNDSNSNNNRLVPQKPPNPLPSNIDMTKHLGMVLKEDQNPILLFTISAAWLSRLGTVALGFAKHKPTSSSISPSKNQVPKSGTGSVRVKVADVNQRSMRGLPNSTTSNNSGGVMNLWKSNPSVTTSSSSSKTGDAELDELELDQGEDGEANQSGGTLKGRSVSQPIKNRDDDNDDFKLDDEERSKTLNGNEILSIQAEKKGSNEEVITSPTPNRRNKNHPPTATARLSKMFEGWMGSGSNETGNSNPTSPELNNPTSPASPKTTFQSLPFTPSPANRERPVQGTMGRSGKILSVSGPLELEIGSPTAQGVSRSDSIASLTNRPMSIASSNFNPQDESEQDLDLNDPDVLNQRFELLMSDLGIKGQSRTAMLSLNDDRKKFLISQNDSAKGNTKSNSNSSSTNVQSAQPEGYGTISGGSNPGMISDTISRASALVGGGTWGNRFSMASITSWGTSDTVESLDDNDVRHSLNSHGNSNSSRPTTMMSGDQNYSPNFNHKENYNSNVPLPLINQKTGSVGLLTELKTHNTGSSSGTNNQSLWSSWWGSGAGANSSSSTNTTPSLDSNLKNNPNLNQSIPSNSNGNGNGNSNSKDQENSAFYANALLDSKFEKNRKDLVKHLISLRVTLSSAKLGWIDCFLNQNGLEAFEKTLKVETDSLINFERKDKDKGLSSKVWGNEGERKEMSDIVMGECIKCLRTLMNTEVSLKCWCGEKSFPFRF